MIVKGYADAQDQFMEEQQIVQENVAEKLHNLGSEEYLESLKDWLREQLLGEVE